MSTSMSFGQRVIHFHEQLTYSGPALPDGIGVINPFIESTAAMDHLRLFANKYFNDDKQRHIILGINPSRFGAGVTGIPFTDTKRLVSECKIPYDGKPTHEISSVFIYEMIHAFGGVSDFYSRFYINSPIHWRSRRQIRAVRSSTITITTARPSRKPSIHL